MTQKQKTIRSRPNKASEAEILRHLYEVIRMPLSRVRWSYGTLFLEFWKLGLIKKVTEESPVYEKLHLWYSRLGNFNNEKKFLKTNGVSTQKTFQKRQTNTWDWKLLK